MLGDFFGLNPSFCHVELNFSQPVKYTVTGLDRTNRIYHWSSMQTEKFQPEGKRIMPETRFNEFPALSVNPRFGISRSPSETDD